jgi:hypothetical protein
MVREGQKRDRAILERQIEEERQLLKADMDKPFYAERTKVRQLLTDCCFFTDTPLIVRVQDMVRINALLEYLLTVPAFLAYFAEFRSFLLKKLEEIKYPRKEHLFHKFFTMLCDLPEREDYILSRPSSSNATTWLGYEFK